MALDTCSICGDFFDTDECSEGYQDIYTGADLDDYTCTGCQEDAEELVRIGNSTYEIAPVSGLKKEPDYWSWCLLNSSDQPEEKSKYKTRHEAIKGATEWENGRSDREAETAEEERYGTYADQVRSYYNSTRI